MFPVLPDNVKVVLFVPVHTAVAPAIVPATDVGSKVIVSLTDTSAHPPVPVIVYVIMDVPALTPVTAPVDASIVATEVVADVHVPPVTDELSVVEPFEQIALVPVIVPADGAAVTVIV